MEDFKYTYMVYTENGVYTYRTNENHIQLENNLSQYKFLWIEPVLIPVKTITLVSLIEERP